MGLYKHQPDRKRLIVANENFMPQSDEYRILDDPVKGGRLALSRLQQKIDADASGQKGWAQERICSTIFGAILLESIFTNFFPGSASLHLSAPIRK